MSRRFALLSFGAATAAAATIAGVTASTSTSHAGMPSRQSNFDGEVIYPGTARNDETRLLSWLDHTTMPILNQARAVPNEPHHRAWAAHDELPKLRLAMARIANCQTQWHPLLEGPAGRQVANLCDGQALLPLPHYELSARTQLKLPTPESFLRQLNLDVAAKPWSSDAREAARASRDVLGTLEREVEHQTPRDRDERARPLPVGNALAWSANSSV